MTDIQVILQTAKAKLWHNEQICEQGRKKDSIASKVYERHEKIDNGLRTVHYLLSLLYINCVCITFFTQNKIDENKKTFFCTVFVQRW